MNSTKKDCYALVQAVTIARDIFCRAPGCSSMATAGHHLYKRDRMATAFNPRYVVGLCVDCHGWAHAEPDEFKEWVISWMGDDYHDGFALSRTIVKYQDFDQIRANLRRELAKYKTVDFGRGE